MMRAMLFALALAGLALASHDAQAGAGDWRTIAWSAIAAVIAAGAVVVVVAVAHPGHRRHGHLPDGDSPPD